MTDDSGLQAGSCNCGRARFSITGGPLFRMYCHCLICQEFNQAEYADVIVYYRKDVALQDERSVEYRVHRQPPLLKRGTCTNCGKPAIEKLSIPLMPGMTIIPTGNIANKVLLPLPKLHIFYHRRKRDAEDTLPKYSGYLSSQSGFGLAATMAMFHRRT